MKPLAKKAVVAVLGYQIRKLKAKNQFKVVGVVGSIGKTSTKLAIAQVLSQGFKVQYQQGNYNDLVSVPLIFFGESLPSLYNPLAWLGLFWRNQKALAQKYPYDIVVVELGSDTPGQINEFKRYLDIEIGVVSAITPEHMENFADLDAVAKEELALATYSSLLIVNKDLVDDIYLKGLDDILTYGIEKPANYSLKEATAKTSVVSDGGSLFDIDTANRSGAELYSVLAASTVSLKLGMEPAAIKKGIASIKPVPGRMQQLAGINGSTIIDDSYNASPQAVELAINSLYKIKAPQKIALLGNMNELGKFSPSAHTTVGKLCDPKQLDLVVTLGPDANKFTATAAEHQGCEVKRFDSPYEAGDYLKQMVKPGAVVLVKGSQNWVFAEEAIKSLLADPKDADKLVRQSDHWLAVKKKAFNR